MNILELIKNRATIRNYSSRTVSKSAIAKIIDAGRWASSLHGYQPWNFVVVNDTDCINRISSALHKKMNKANLKDVNIFLASSLRSISNSKLLILIYGTQEFLKFTGKLDIPKEFKHTPFSIAELSEHLAIGAVVQNMILTASFLGIASCWHVSPLFCKDEINKIIHSEHQLMSILTLGYPYYKVKRFKRKPVNILFSIIDKRKSS